MRSRPEPIVALDVESLADARSIVRTLGERADFYKVGLQLFAADGPRAVEWLRGEGKRVFLDLKLHDIPRTVHRAAESARRLGATLLTVHGSGGESMVRAAVDGAGEETNVLAVTVLTSFDLESASRAIGRRLESIEGEVLRLAAVARDAGARGVVCAGAECAAVRDAHGDRLRRLIPGIRGPGAAQDDQSRITSAAEAAKSGATYVVLGRVVTAATDPPGAYERVVADLA